MDYQHEIIYPVESVYSCIPTEEEEVKKPPRYVSKFRPAVVLESKLTKDAQRMMGPAKVELPSPQNYLKKHSRDLKPPQKTQPRTEDCPCVGRKPPVPLRTEPPPMGTQTRRDLTRAAILVPGKPTPISVDTNKGHKQPLENSGLVPKYIWKKDYGAVPLYLQQRGQMEQKLLQKTLQQLKDQREQEALQLLTAHEQQHILQSLKRKWDALHLEYQGLPLIIDTLSKKAHKLRLEEAMKRLEQDIGLFQRYRTIYVPKE
ncbi:enkurin [Menidia menidia]